MTSINRTLGLKPAGTRAMMNLPKNKAKAAALTRAPCPKCRQRGVREAPLGYVTWFCLRCGASWMPGPVAREGT